MKRRLFAILPFVGAAWGQQSALDTTGTAMAAALNANPFYCGYCRESFATETERDAHDCSYHFQNGRCPVCGQMAKPWKVKYVPGSLGHCHPADDKGMLMACNWEMVPDGPTFRQERCSRCNASFWTDGEKD